VSTDPGGPVARPAGLRLHRWNDRAVAGVAIAAFASGFGQFGVVAALGDVARGFGQVTHGAALADQAGLSGTELGIGLAVMRLASLGGLPVTGLADRFGRRMMLLLTVGAGLAMTVAAAASPGYWWFVAIFACGRPLLRRCWPATSSGRSPGSVFAPAAGSLVNELFLTPVRALVAGWSLAAGVLGAVTGLVVFGAVAGAGNRFGVAGLVTFMLAALAMTLFWLLPETRGREPEDLWPGS
jgi:MFS family permease